jgi:type I restriction enzyme, S subunit
MNAERLLAYYERIADASEAIARLRRFILDLAVRGKLLSQDPNDEPASELLKRIAKEKARLVKAGELRKPRDLDSGNDLNEPFAIPMTWRWVRLDAVGAIVGGGTPSAADADNFAEPGEGVPWLTPADLGGYSDLYISRGSRDLSEKGSRSSSATVMPKGSVLFTSRAPIGYVAIASNPLSTNQGFKSIVPYIADCSRFVATAMKAFAPEIDAKAPGTTFKEVSGKIVAAIPFPLPPLAEQHRIVAKVDELMGLCDRLETARGGRERSRDRLAAASLARLNAPDPATFQVDARFALDALPALTTRPDQIKALRQTILNLAVRGKLVPQDANDEPASVLLRRVAKGDWAQRTVPAWSDGSDNDLPTGWETALIEHCFNVSGGIQKTPARTPKGNAFPYLGVGNVYRGRLDLRNVKQFELTDGELEHFGLRSEDILIVEGNGSANEIGRCAVWHDEIENCVHQNHIIRCRPKLLDMTPYAALYLNSPEGVAEMKRLAITSAGLFSLSVGKIRKISFSVPPLAEQRRIVAKVDELMALCDRLEASLTAADATRRHLLDALLAQALAPAEDRELDAAE